ncbi:MAG: hypothetical protein Q8S32_17195 [Burkholderiaceae bacterium]|nr:hypothetical protein [Burkholderiaceae bacterium]
MPTADPLDGRILHLQIDILLSPRTDSSVGHTDPAADIGKRIALEAGLIAKRLGGDGCDVVVERQITVY